MTIEQVAKFLLKKKIPFNYTTTSIEVKDSSFTDFKYVSYYSGGRQKLVFMDSFFDEVLILKDLK